MRRLPALAFGALVIATAGAFFLTQHLKASTPLIAGSPAPVPAAINPLGGRCGGVQHAVSYFSFYLLHSSDSVDVTIVNAAGVAVRTIARDHRMRRGVRHPDGDFSWNGREGDGRVAPDGYYEIRVRLRHQGRTVTIGNAAGPEPIRIEATPPRPRVTSVNPALVADPDRRVSIAYAGNETRSGTVRVFRTDLPGRPRLVKSFLTPWHAHEATWDLRIARRPAPEGTYLVGLDVTDAACNTGHFPDRLPPVPGSTRGAGLTLRFLAGEPPPAGARAGQRFSIPVQSAVPFRWSVIPAGGQGGGSREGGGAPQHGAGVTGARIAIPPLTAGLYRLVLSSRLASAVLPLVVGGGDAPGSSVMVVAPALTWEGAAPVDEDDDGIPDTLLNSRSIPLGRPLSGGLPPGFQSLADVLRTLSAAHARYSVTTDVALSQSAGHGADPLTGFHAVLLAGSATWLPENLTTALRAYVQGGGHVIVVGSGGLLRRAGLRGALALSPTPLAPRDPFGAGPGPSIPARRVVARRHDQLRILPASIGPVGIRRPFSTLPPGADVLSAAGAPGEPPSVVVFRLGRGLVAEVGIADFGLYLPHDAQARYLLTRLWKVLAG